MIDSVFPINFKWFIPDWNYRCKISIGILEFFLDSVSFNPNDEFGDDSLYLCSPIEHSFASTFLNDAKLVNYDEVMNGRDLRELLAEQTCYSDDDCIYTKQCQTRCDTRTNLCTSELVKPQIAYFCSFLRDYLFGKITTHIRITVFFEIYSYLYLFNNRQCECNSNSEAFDWKLRKIETNWKVC